jgi:hypothetical protein
MKKLLDKEITELMQENPFWYIDQPPLVIKTYKNGRKKMFVRIKDNKYCITQNKEGKDEWFKIINGSNK